MYFSFNSSEITEYTDLKYQSWLQQMAYLLWILTLHVVQCHIWCFDHHWFLLFTFSFLFCRYYNYLYTHLLNSYSVKSIVDQMQNCEDILLNFLVSHVTNLPPVKVTQRKLYKESMIPNNNGKSSVWLNTLHFVQRQSCIHNFTNAFGYMPLIRSNLRMDPILFKDPVSNLRKKYRQIELV